ncbi:alpha/beta fold hydrolase [Gynuella sp.]|uniref:alpha/beta fold hydrolase n=1 Tax=Gynuella sp. TaxID=2969146 RepID=UPI003D13AF6F
MSFLKYLSVIALSTIMSVSVAQTTIKDETIAVGKQSVRYLSAGDRGIPVILLHGWPQSADEWRDVIPALAEKYRVFAPDLSGIGGTTAVRNDWSKAALAQDVHRFAKALKLDKPLLVGHDIGGMVAYAYARQFADDLTAVAILDVPIPGLAPWQTVATSSHAWHFDFHRQEGLAETLVAGQEAVYIRYFINKVAANPKAISDADVAVYAEAYGTKEKLTAGFELYRAFSRDADFFQAQSSTLDLPLLIVGAQYSTQALLPLMEKSFRAQGVSNIETAAIENSGHWISEEQPDKTAEVLLTFFEKIILSQ